MPTPRDPVAAANDEARRIAQGLLQLPHAALAYSDPESGTPGISRIAFGLAPDGGALTFVSTLAPHFHGLNKFADCSILLGEPGSKGDPLVHPRLMLRAKATIVEPEAAERPALRDAWLVRHPKSKLYVDFADFFFVRLAIQSALLNGGFGKAFRLSADDLTPNL